MPFVLKSTLPDINIATPSFLWLYLFLSFPFQVICILESKGCLYRQSDNLYILIGQFNPLTFNIIIDIVGFTSSILFFVFCMSYLLFCSSLPLSPLSTQKVNMFLYNIIISLMLFNYIS